MTESRLMLGDCLERMAEIADGSVDMILADLPYGTTACKWDQLIPFAPMWAHFKRVCKPNAAIVLTAAQPFTSALIMSNVKMFKYCWVWDKHIPRGFATAKFRPMMKHEDVAVFCDGKTPYFPELVERAKPVTVKNYAKKGNNSSNSIGDFNTGQSFTYTHKTPDSIIVGCWEANAGKVHPTQKPVALMAYLIRTYTQPGETVLDCCFGSGTTGVACKQEGRNFIGIERDPAYFAIAERRIADCDSLLSAVV